MSAPQPEYSKLGIGPVGTLNWGLVGLFNFNLVNALFGGVPMIESAVYILVGIAALGMIYTAASLAGEETTKPA